MLQVPQYIMNVESYPSLTAMLAQSSLSVISHSRFAFFTCSHSRFSLEVQLCKTLFIQGACRYFFGYTTLAAINLKVVLVFWNRTCRSWLQSTMKFFYKLARMHLCPRVANIVSLKTASGRWCPQKQHSDIVPANVGPMACTICIML